jgi:hypothetical protein
MGAEVFHGRVRDGIGCVILAMTTGPPCRTLNRQQMAGCRVQGRAAPRHPDDRIWVCAGWECVCTLHPGWLGTGDARLGAARGGGWSLRTTLAGAALEVERYRAIRTARLRGLPLLHLRPINVVVFHGPRRDLVSRSVSRLDAFSGYPFRTWPPGRAAGATTGSPEVRPSRSSRTRDGSSQVSYTHSR